MMCRCSIDELNDGERLRVQQYETDHHIQVIEVAKDEDQIRPTLINGRAVDRDDWLEVVRIGNHSCSGTVVGKNCVLTAAHCGRHGGRSTLEIYRRGRINYRIVHMPQYNGGSNYDLAVLVLDSDVHDDVKPARVGIDYTFRVGSDVDILGYGCTRAGGGGGNDGVLRWGESRVQGFTGTDVITSHRPSGAALCFGDSGGPMMKDGSQNRPRTLIAINSKGNIRDTNYNMRLDLDSVKQFLESAADRYDLQILGVTDDPEPPPPPPPPPDGNAAWAELAKDHRLAIEHHEALATKYEELAKDTKNGGNGNGTFGL